MSRLRLNGIAGTASSNPLTVADITTTTVTWASSPAFATIVAPDYYVITAEADTAAEEIMWLVAFAAGATTGTVIRAAEPVNGARTPFAHAAVAWNHGPTAMDFAPPALDFLLSDDGASDPPNFGYTRVYADPTGTLYQRDATGRVTALAPETSILTFAVAGERPGAGIEVSLDGADVVTAGNILLELRKISLLLSEQLGARFSAQDLLDLNPLGPHVYVQDTEPLAPGLDDLWVDTS